jgi:hypothetical protein
MKKLLLVLVFFELTYPCFAQEVCTTCGPSGLENYRTNVIGNREKDVPYNGIVRLIVTRFFFWTNYSTASFIADDIIITANHNVMYSPFITKVEIHSNDEWFKLK